MIDLRKENGKKVRKLRMSQGLSQEEFAEIISVNAQQVSKIERGRSYLTYRVIEAMCDKFNKKPKYFFDFDEIKQTPNDLEKITYIEEKVKELNSQKLTYLKKIVKAFLD